MLKRIATFFAAFAIAGAALAQKAPVFSDGGAAIRGAGDERAEKEHRAEPFAW